MKFNVAMRKECVTVNADGSYTVKGGGWFWVRMDRKGNVLEMAPNMAAKKAARLFISQAKLTIQKHYPMPTASDMEEQVKLANEIISEIIEEEKNDTK
jgi:hypothetical protein